MSVGYEDDGGGVSVTVVTGAASGIGAGIARRLAPLPGALVLTDLNGSALQVLADELVESRPKGCDTELIAGDVSDPEFVVALARCAARRGSFRRLAHAAGTSSAMGSDWRRTVDVNLVATARMVSAFRELAVLGSALVCIASSGGHSIRPLSNEAIDAVLDDPLAPDLIERLETILGARALELTSYAWAKLGVMRLVGRLAAEWGVAGARICSVSPGIIDTPMARRSNEQNPRMAKMTEATPLGRWGTTDELAAAVEFLLSDDASFITGIDLLVDGGVMTKAPGMMRAILEDLDSLAG